jgi:hypothetical protein
MDIKGVCYDTGRAYAPGFVTRQVFDPAMTRRELQIIRDDLHCNAVRFQGTDIGRLMTAAADALTLGGLQVWLSPELFKKSRKATIAYLAQAAAAAGPLHEQFPGRLVFCVGTESSLFTNGIVPGRTTNQKIASIRRAGLQSGPYAKELQAFLAEASDAVRKAFHGPLTYARPRSRWSTGACSTSSASTTTGTPRTRIATPRRSGATSGRASPWSTPSSGTVPTAGTARV